MKKEKVLFVCVHNAARSQMAEAFLAHCAGDRYSAESAGLEPGTLNPLVVKVMQEKHIDISSHTTDSVFDFYQQGRMYDYVITVCDESQAQNCPVFPNTKKQLHWSFDDPSTFTGTEEEKLVRIRKVRDRIEVKVKEWIGSQ